MPGMTPKRFLSESVTPAQWWVFILGIETISSARFKVRGSASVASEVCLEPIANQVDVVVIQVDELEARFIEDRSPSPDWSSTSWASRQWPGPSATKTSRARQRRKTSAAARTTARWVLISGASRNGSTRFGFKRTDRAVHPRRPEPQLVQSGLDDRLEILGRTTRPWR